MIECIKVLYFAILKVYFLYFLKAEEVATKALDKAVGDYLRQPGAKKLLDWAQQKFSCCGTKGPKDYKLSSTSSSSNSSTNATSSVCGDKTPRSCHAGNECSGDQFKTGCKKEFINFLQDHLVTIGAVAIGIAFIQVNFIAF